MSVIVAGGGASGMMAAIGAAEYGKEVTLLERNEKLGKKIYITGKGRCNLTNDCSSDALMNHVVHNPKFLYSAFNAWSNQDMISFMRANNCPVKTERGDRVFPESDHASDVIRALSKRLNELGVRVVLGAYVTSLIIDNGCIRGVVTDDKKEYFADSVILALGGASYPTTGSDGRFIKLLGKTGHSVNELRPALVPLLSDDAWMKDVQGLSLKNVVLTLKRGSKKVYHELGEMLFTGQGISGPLGLSASSYYEPGDAIEIDLKPALDDKKLDERILRDFKQYNNKDYANALNDLLPKSLIGVIVRLSGISPDKKVHQITSAERTGLVRLLKHLEVTVSGTAGFDEAIITRGGIPVSEIEPSTMRSRLVDGLFFAGEMIDTDALTGGFNLQIAWSTGYLAGISS